MNKNRIIEDYLQGKHPIEQESWELPSAQELERDEALFESLVPQKKAPKRIRLWPLAAAACVAGFVAIFLAPPSEANVEPEKQPVVAEQKEKQEETVVKEEPAETKTEVEAPKRTKRAAKRKLVVPHEPVEEPLLAEAEINASHLGEVGRGAKARPILPEMKDPFLAIAQQMQDIRSLGEQVCQEVDQLMDNQVNLQ